MESVEEDSSENVLLAMAPHTKAKHQVLTEYLKGWFPILATYDKRIVYLDGFAGPGEYSDSEHSLGSPIIAIQTALNHKLFATKLSKNELMFLFVEKEQKRVEHLLKKLGEMYGSKGDGTYEKLPPTWKVSVESGEFSKMAGPIVSGLEDKKLNMAPTMAFIDPFGYRDLDLDLMGRILRFPKCELLITYMTGFMDRFSNDAMKENSIQKMLRIDSEILTKVRSIAVKEVRDLEWLKLLNDGIINAASRQAEVAGAPLAKVFRLAFKLKDRNNNVMYYLVYFTKDLKGIEVMKGAMYRSSRNWNYTFSDYDFNPDQTTLLDYTKEQPWLQGAARLVREKFKGRMLVPFLEIKDFVLEYTPYYFRAAILEQLEKEGEIMVHRGNARRNSYPETCFIDFK